jgi:hypothetical protein
MWFIKFSNESKSILTHNKQRQVSVYLIMSMWSNHQLKNKPFWIVIIYNKS